MKNSTPFVKVIFIVFLFTIIHPSFSQTVLYTDNFESGWGVWVDGGDNCQLVNPSPLDLGTSVELKNGTGSSNTYTNNINLTSYDSASLEFAFKTERLSNGEGFFMEFSNNGGSSWTNLFTYTVGTNISNDVNYSHTRTITNTSFGFTNSSRFRFRANGNNPNDKIYLDNIIIRVYGGGPEIDVRGNNISIADEDTTPNTGDNTDYGNVNLGTVVTKTFTIHNSGTSNLEISSINLSNNTDFAIVGTPYATTVAPGSSTSFNVSFKTLTIGIKTTTVTINNNDTNESVYNYLISAGAHQNFFDSDGDGVFDNVDIDDDNDGIQDNEEELACKRSSFSKSVNYKFLNETFGTGTGRTTINTTNYAATTSYCFEDGIVGPNTTQCPFQSSKILDDGEYTVVSKITGTVASDPDNIHGDLAWTSSPDHTPNDTNGRMAVFNASFTPGVFYETNITGVLSNIPITYNFWAMNIMARNLYPGTILPDITVQFLDFSGNILATINTGPFGRCSGGTGDNSCPQSEWLQFTTSLNLGDITDFKVRFINNASGGGGNDLAIDDIVISQTLCDTDGDGVADVFDLDSDNDGIPDVVEAGLGALSEGKATLTYTSGWVDNNGNGMHDLTEGHITLDSDGDGTPNYLDLDSDNDAIFDVDESGAGNTAELSYQNGDGDINGDGVGDGPDTDLVRKKDFDSDGVVELFADGILDIYDYYTGSTFETAYGNVNQGIGSTYFVKDSDNDGIPDYIDITSDGSNYDISRTLYAHLDANNDGRVDGNTDAEGDGLLDLFDTNDAAFGSPRDLDKKLHLFFDGRNDYAQDVSVINGWGESTMMTWIKIDPTSYGAQRIMGQDQFYLELQSTRTMRVNAKGTSITASTRLNTNRWYHIATSYSSISGLLKLYINGLEAASTSISGSLPTDISLLTLGKSSSADTNYYKGYLEEVRVFNKALSSNEIQKMVYQEIQKNGSFVRGAIIPRDLTNYISPTNNVPLDWTSLKRYYRMDTYKGDVIDDLSTASVDVSSGMRIYNTKHIDYQNAPLPFVTKQSGTLSAAVDDSGNGVRGTDATMYDYSIVHVKHKDISYNSSQKHLALIINQFDASSNPIDFNVQNDSELNVSWYLKLDGTIKLEGESQLVQGDASELDATSVGKLLKNQQGTADKFTYNYWSSPVGVSNNLTNNNSYRVKDVMTDGPNNINWLTSGYNGTNTSPIGIADYWVWKYANLPNNSYASWQHIRSTGMIRAGEGFTMKGPGTGSIQTNQNYLFTGKPNNGDIDLTLNSGNDYLVGNPYPSAIDGDKFIMDNGPIISGIGSTSGTLYFWEHWGGGSHNLRDYQGGYAIYNLSGGTPSATKGENDINVGMGGTPTKIPGRYIPVGQGFFVVAEGDGGIIKFRNSQRFFQKEGANSIFVRQADGAGVTNYNPDGEDLRMKFRIGFNSVNTIHRQLLLTIDSNATEDIDWGYDAKYIDNQMDDMYWMISDEKFNIQAIDTIIQTSVVPLGLHLRNGGQNNISIDHLENVSDEIQIFVHDKVLNTYHNLRKSQFVFNLPAGAYLDRFELTFQEGSVLSVKEDELTTLDIYYVNNSENLVLVNPDLKDIKSIEMFNIMGQSICTIKPVENTIHSEYKVKNLSSGAYIVKVITDNGITSKKVLVK